jgi:PTS system nitrogen regulatory IIA component
MYVEYAEGKMNSVAKVLPANEVLLDLDVGSKQTLFEAVGRIWEEHHGMQCDEVVDSLNAREKVGSTGLGQGVAIPHARVKGLTKAVAAFVRPKLPIEFDSPDGEPVAYCFVLLVPAQATEEHLKILAEVAEMLSNTDFREQLGTTTSPDKVHQLFCLWRSPITERAHS